MNHWQALNRAIEARGRPVHLWWRDDDAHRHDPQLDSLLALSERYHAPVTLAVVPQWLQPSLADTLTPHAGRVQCAVHGFAHADHAKRPVRKCEYPETRPTADITAELKQGIALLRDALPTHWLPAFVPPWNRFDPTHYPALSAAGFKAFSARYNNEFVPDLQNWPIHIDIINWRDKSFAGLDHCTRSLIDAIETAGEQPIGIMTHHLDHDADCWAYLDQLLGFIAEHDHSTLLPLTTTRAA